MLSRDAGLDFQPNFLFSIRGFIDICSGLRNFILDLIVRYIQSWSFMSMSILHKVAQNTSSDLSLQLKTKTKHKKL